MATLTHRALCTRRPGHLHATAGALARDTAGCRIRPVHLHATPRALGSADGREQQRRSNTSAGSCVQRSPIALCTCTGRGVHLHRTFRALGLIRRLAPPVRRAILPTDKETSMVVEYIRYTIDEGRADAFAEGYRQAAASLDASPHCLRYEVSRCSEDPTQHVVRIEWDSEEGH